MADSDSDEKWFHNTEKIVQGLIGAVAVRPPPPWPRALSLERRSTSAPRLTAEP